MVKRIFAVSGLVLAVGMAMGFNPREAEAGGCWGTSSASDSKNTGTSMGCGWSAPSSWSSCEDGAGATHNHHHHHGHDVAKTTKANCRSTRDAGQASGVSGSSSGGIAARDTIAWRELPLSNGAVVIALGGGWGGGGGGGGTTGTTTTTMATTTTTTSGMGGMGGM